MEDSPSLPPFLLQSLMINDTTFKNNSQIFLIKFHSERENKLNFACQNRHYSKWARHPEYVCRGQHPSAGWERAKENWCWQVEECSIIRNILLVSALGCQRLPESSRWKVCRWVGEAFQLVFIDSCRISVHPTSENNFTAFLCRWKIAMKMINRNCSRKGFYDAELPPNSIPFQLALPLVSQEKVLSFVNSIEIKRTFLD